MTPEQEAKKLKVAYQILMKEVHQLHLKYNRLKHENQALKNEVSALKAR